MKKLLLILLLSVTVSSQAMFAGLARQATRIRPTLLTRNYSTSSKNTNKSFYERCHNLDKQVNNTEKELDKAFERVRSSLNALKYTQAVLERACWFMAGALSTCILVDHLEDQKDSNSKE
ncbi:hypothetical protein K9K77_03135 [Candidatus Babeliales bacterium]|nr:hypothetical protein [Candidatus Babeliales bacterium]